MKAAVGEKCTRCGQCCQAIPCAIGLTLFGEQRPCVALEKEKDGKRLCGLVSNPSKYIDMGEQAKWKDTFISGFIANMLGVGRGCCSSVVHSAIAKRFREIKLGKVRSTEATQ